MKYPHLAGRALTLLASACCANGIAETSIGVYSGASRTSDSDLHIVQPGLGTDLVARDVPWSARPLKPAPYYGLKVSWFPTAESRWGASLDFTHYKVYARTAHAVGVQGTWMGGAVAGTAPVDRYVQRFELSHGVNMLSANVLYRWNSLGLFSGRLTPYVGAGLAGYLPHSESTVGAVPHEAGYHPAGLGVHLQAGARYRLTERFAVFVETKFDHGRAKVDVASGTARTRLQTVHLVGGIAMDF
jgi:lipid A oxidase